MKKAALGEGAAGGGRRLQCRIKDDSYARREYPRGRKKHASLTIQVIFARVRWRASP